MVGCRLWGRTESDTTEVILQELEFAPHFLYLLLLSSKRRILQADSDSST